ncbi:hypothetical protein ABL78_0598 [Leptomonas seymouri]|uniref:CFA20 domain-containing protein n=1 Tax=Leptomonas seymouri TaxID=5684 RepID=A0A0N0P8Q2_LEPSE|nr:hypothetical protein ABL78_0598 [Leptomonas seymouri]|eukprot:KPI90216.1 hypothetical protein ABL78_0598 [Leptomonas seymouri]
MHPYFFSHYTPPSHSLQVSATAAQHAGAHHRPLHSPSLASRLVPTTETAKRVPPTAQYGSPSLPHPSLAISNTAATPPSPFFRAVVTHVSGKKDMKEGASPPPSPPTLQPVSSVPCLVLYSPQGPRPLEGLTTTNTSTSLSQRGSADGFAGRRASLQNRTASVNRPSGLDGPGKPAAGLRGAAQTLSGIRCVYDRDTRSQLLHISPGTEADFSAFVRLPGFTRGPAVGGGGGGTSVATAVSGHTILAVQFCVAAPVLPASERYRVDPSSQQQPQHKPVPPYFPPPGSVYVELVVRAIAGSSHNGPSMSTSSTSVRGGYRLRFTNAVHEVHRHPHHTRIPLQCVRTAQWMQLYIDVDSVMHTCAQQGGTKTAAAVATPKATTTVFRLHQLRIGAGAVPAAATDAGNGSGGLYIRRIVAGHGLPLPQHPGVDHVVHPAGQHSIPEAMSARGGNGSDSVHNTWTLPEPLRLPAEAGETLSVFVHTGEELILRTLPALPSPSPAAPPLEEEAARCSPGHAVKAELSSPQPELQQPQQLSTSELTHVRSGSLGSSSPSATPRASVPQAKAGQESGGAQRSSTPVSAQPDLHNADEGSAKPQHHELQPAAVQTSPIVKPKEKSHRDRPTALELLRVRQRQQHPSIHQAQSRPRPSRSYVNSPAIRVTEEEASSVPSSSLSPSPLDAEVLAVQDFTSARSQAMEGGVSSPALMSQRSREARDQRGIYEGPRRVAGQSKAARQQEEGGWYVAEGTPIKRAGGAADYPAASAPALMSSSRNPESLYPPQVGASKLPASDEVAPPSRLVRRGALTRPAFSLDDGAGEASDTTTLFASATSMETSSVASAPTPSSTSSSTLSCASAAVELMREVNERVSRIRAVLTEREGSAPSLDVPPRLRMNAVPMSTAAAASSLPAPPRAPALALPPAEGLTKDEDSDNVATPRAGVRRAPTPSVQAPPANALRAATPLSLLAAVMGDDWRGDAAASQTMNATAHDAGKRIESEGDGAEPTESFPHSAGAAAAASASAAVADRGDTKMVLELWSSTEVPLQLPNFAAQQLRPTSRRAVSHTVAKGEGDAVAYGHTPRAQVLTAHTLAAGGSVDAALTSYSQRAEMMGTAGTTGEHEFSERRGDAPALLPPGSTVTSWTFQSASIEPATTFAASENTAAGLRYASAAAAATAAGALPREDGAHGLHMPAGGPYIPFNAPANGRATPHSATKAVVWRRSASAVRQREVGGRIAAQRATSDDVCLDDNTPLAQRPVRQTDIPGATTPADAVAQVKQGAVQRQELQSHLPPVPLAPTVTSLPGDGSGSQTPLTGHFLNAPSSLYTGQIHGKGAMTTTQAAGTTGYHGASPTSHLSYSTVSSFHMWLPDSMPVQAASCMRYPSLTTPSSGAREGMGKSGGRSQQSLHSSRNTGDVATADAMVRRAVPPVVRLSAAGNTPRVQAGALAPSRGERAVKAGADGAPSALYAGQASPQAQLDRRGQTFERETHPPVAPGQGHAAPRPDDRGAPVAVTSALADSGAPKAVHRYMYDSVLGCYLDLAANAYVEKAM